MKKIVFFVSVAFVVSILIPFDSVQAFWTDDATVNKTITTAARNQKDAVSVSDGAGGAIIAWEDRRYDTGSYDHIYVQRIDSKGNVLWTTDGVLIAGITTPNPVSHRNLAIVSDGAGGAIITWDDNRDGTDIFAQRLNAAGSLLWTPNGVQISTTEGPDPSINGSNKSPSITSDGSGGAIIAWENSQYDPSYDPGKRYADSIYAQKVDADGNVQWTPDVCISDGSALWVRNRYKLRPKIVSDGSGGAIITWDDNRGSSCDIYAQWVDNNGDPKWTGDGQGISRANGIQQSPQIVSDGAGGAIISWVDTRLDTGCYDIYAQRVSTLVEGNPRLWQSPDGAWEGIPVSINDDRQLEDKKMVSDGAGGAIISWLDYNYYNVYVQRVDVDGNVLWAGDRHISPAAHRSEYYYDEEYEPTIVSDGSGGAIIAWHDDRNIYDPCLPYDDGDECPPEDQNYENTPDESSDIYAQRVDADGNGLWAAGGIPISTADFDQAYPGIASDGAGGAIVFWEDPRSDVDKDIYAQRVFYDGTLVDADGDGIPASDDDPQDGDASIATPPAVTGTGKIIIAAGVAPLTNVKSISDADVNQTGKPADQAFPDGLVSFEVEVALGGTIDVEITFPTPIPPEAKYYKVDDNGFHEFAGAVFNGNSVTLTLTDGGDGDADLEANGVILDPGGVAVPADSTTSSSTTSSGSGGSGCFISTIAGSLGW